MNALLTGTVDLHCHSYASPDAAGLPDEIARLFRASGFRAFSMTEHNSILSLETARAAAAENGLEYVPGVEIGAEVDDPDLHDGSGVHILGYDFEVTPALRKLLAGDPGRVGGPGGYLEMMRARGMVDIREEAWRARVRLRFGDTQVAAWPGVGREVLGQLMQERGVLSVPVDCGRETAATSRSVELRRQAMVAIMGSLRPPWKNEAAAGAGEVCRILRAAGAVVILAHPGSGRREPCEYERRRINRWLDLHVDGVEVYHHRNSPAYRHMLLEIVLERNRPYTGGGDRHGYGAEGHVSEAPYRCLELLRAARRRPTRRPR